MKTYHYQNSFYDYLEEGSSRSARAILPLLKQINHVSSVLDVGSGRGAWVREWLDSGVSDALAIDGEYIDTKYLLIPNENFIAKDVSKFFDLERRFDLVTSFEVAEHIHPEKSGVFVENLIRHADLIVFSSAVPGQGGENHLNEQPFEFWRNHFAEHGYLCFDYLRPLIERNFEIETWYRYNTLLFASERILHTLPHRVLETRIREGATIKDKAPFHNKLRRKMFRFLPIWVVTRLAILKHFATNSLRYVFSRG